MSRKPRKKKRPGKPALGPAQFAVGAKVRVRAGVVHPDYADMPLGGWVGTIMEISEHARSRSYLVAWDQETLAQMHPVYRQRCLRDEENVENLVLKEEDLEADQGERPPMEQPRVIVTRPLSPFVRDDRIRAIFGLTSDDPLPPVGAESLRRYHQYLRTHLAFPFQARFFPELELLLKQEAITVTHLLDLEEGSEAEGLLCAALQDGKPVVVVLGEISAMVNVHNHELIEDYAHWFYQSNFETDDALGAHVRDVTEPAKATGADLWMTFKLMMTYALWGGILAAPAGALLATQDFALGGAIVGCLPGGFLGRWLASSPFASFDGEDLLGNPLLYRRMIGAALGVLLGVWIGALLIALISVVAGGLFAALLCAWWLRERYRIAGIVLGGIAGGLAQAWYFAPEQAPIGALYGAVVGATIGLLTFPGIFGLFYLFIVVQGGPRRP